VGYEYHCEISSTFVDMNVKQLIEKLSTYDPKTMVIVSGYEGGVDEAHHAGEVKIKLDVYTEWYYGKHEVADRDDDPFDCEAIYIH
jgi:hypothetical protein